MHAQVFRSTPSAEALTISSGLGSYQVKTGRCACVGLARISFVILDMVARNRLFPACVPAHLTRYRNRLANGIRVFFMSLPCVSTLCRETHLLSFVSLKFPLL